MGWAGTGRAVSSRVFREHGGCARGVDGRLQQRRASCRVHHHCMLCMLTRACRRSSPTWSGGCGRGGERAVVPVGRLISNAAAQAGLKATGEARGAILSRRSGQALHTNNPHRCHHGAAPSLHAHWPCLHRQELEMLTCSSEASSAAFFCSSSLSRPDPPELARGTILAAGRVGMATKRVLRAAGLTAAARAVEDSSCMALKFLISGLGELTERPTRVRGHVFLLKI